MNVSGHTFAVNFNAYPADAGAYTLRCRCGCSVTVPRERLMLRKLPAGGYELARTSLKGLAVNGPGVCPRRARYDPS